MLSLINNPPFKSINSNPLFSFLKTNCNGSSPLYAGPFLPGLYFETRRLSPTAFSVLMTNLNTPAQFSLAVTQLAEKKPQCAVLNYQMVQKKYTTNNPVDSYIFSSYHLIYKNKSVLVYKSNK